MQTTSDAQQSLIAESASRLFESEFPLSALRQRDGAWSSPPGLDRSIAESGWLGLCAAESAGGSGLGAREALPVLVEAGRHAAPYPLAESLAVAERLSRMPAYQALAGQLIEGRVRVGVLPASAGEVSVEKVADGWRVSGTWRGVPWASVADRLLACLVLDRPTWSMIDLHTATISRETVTGLDRGCPLADVHLHGHLVREADRVAVDEPAWARMRALFAAAELQGAAQACLDLALAHMKERKQFGQPIGRFQALKHIAANGALRLENMRAANAFAAWAHDAGDDGADEAAHVAKAYASENARLIAEDAIQCHGGIGFTWEYGLHHFLRRIVRLAADCGTTYQHREALLGSFLTHLPESA
jgi:alkylation response protein AidB-like acyl-CoA dehydrogenase